MATKSTAHCTFRNDQLFCTHCGKGEDIQAPIGIGILVRRIHDFNKLHVDCDKTWTPPTADQSKSEEERAQHWWINGERGLSSECMATHLNKFAIQQPTAKGGGPHPSDPDDFRRCHLLLEWMPEYRLRLPRMRAVSKEWSNLVDHWPQLTELLQKESSTNRSHGMYDLMKKLGC